MVFDIKKKSIVIASIGVVTMLLFSACSGSKKETIAAVGDRKDIPKLDATAVTTVVSDSGVTRYRITTEKWLVYDKSDEPYWDFPEGILLENFTTDLDVDASVEADYAIFFEKKQIWELRGDVIANNLEGEKFETEQLFWNQKTERIYSDSLITITRESSIIVGVGFDSNQSLTEYTIKKPTGIFPMKDKVDSTQTNDTVVQKPLVEKPKSVRTETKSKKNLTPQKKIIERKELTR